MFESLGPSYWWPADNPFEVCLGAILTQNTTWSNVDKVIWKIKENNLLCPEKLFHYPEEALANLLRPVGYYRIKTKRLKNFLFFLRHECSFNLDKLYNYELEEIRNKLLKINGIGPETADTIILYALEQPSFVVDTYTARICHRHGLVPSDISYHDLRDFFMDSLPEDIHLYNEFHALFVRVGKKWCKKKSGLCADCALFSFL